MTIFPHCCILPPDKEIRLMLVANVIPDGMKASLKDFNIDFLEVAPSKIRNVASKYGYTFRGVEFYERNNQS
jgi:hypothetical protein